MSALITLDTQKQQNGVSEAFNIQELFNARVGDEQVPFSVKFLERGKAQQFEDGLVPFMSGFVGNLDDDGKVTAETGEPVSYTGSRDDIVGLGMVKMNLPGMMFPQEGYFYGFLGLETPDHSKRVSTFSVWFHVYNGNPDMFVNKEPFRSELQKELDRVEVLIEQTEGTLKAKLIEWEKLITDLISNKNIDLEQLESRMATVEGNLTILEDKIKADGLLTQAEFDAQIKIVNETISNALAELKQPIPVDDTIIVGEPVSAGNKTALDNLKTSIDENKFNMVFITDTHYAQQSELDNYAPGYAVDHLNHALYLDDNVDVIIAGGDNIDGHNNSYPGILNDQKKFAIELLYGSNNHADKFALKGNHDDGSWRLYAYREGNLTYQNSTPETIPFAQFRTDYQNADLLFEEHRNGDSNYFYKDYPEKKVRIVGLDSNDTPEDKLTSDGGLKYVGINYMGYRQAQLDWIANTALQNVPENYTTIIIGHCGADPTPYDDDLSDLTHGHHTNQAQLNKIINNFIKGTSETVTNNVKDFEINVKTDFTAQGPRVMAGYIHGHDHKENYSTTVGFNSIGVINSFGPSWRYGDNDGWNLITLDTQNHQLIFKGFGLATNRTIVY
ncbi:hypothetical protein [Pediococcus pentosaceus]|uniref:hypothetical protein n=1 Tax=Pediococcus pentosaceus TaxID=1255 RepID=UPI002AB3AA4A|nr:hypothetical protein [Pediococcus pentosaceus]MDY8106047.1 hypothetical protein [Pediococcus pentosaceus]